MKTQGQTASRFGIMIGIVLVMVLAALEVFAQHAVAPTESKPPVVKPLARADAERGLYESYSAALASRKWEPMIAHGDAALALGKSSGDPVRHPYVDQARRSYMIGLFRARSAGSIDGMTRVSDAFLKMGDHEAARLALRMAQQTATDERTAATLRDRAERLEDPRIAKAR